jgi:hypothetical protein
LLQPNAASIGVASAGRSRYPRGRCERPACVRVGVYCRTRALGITPTSMTYSARALVVLASSLACGCFGRPAARTQATAECPPVPEADAVPTDAVSLARLTGRFWVVQIDTVRGDQPRDDFLLDLRLLDSVTIATLVRDDERVRAVFRSQPPLKILPLVGSQPGVTPPWRGDQHGLLAWSCWPHRCADDASTIYRFRHVSSRNIRGVWALSSWGIAAGVDPKTGRRLPLPGGVCPITPSFPLPMAGAASRPVLVTTSAPAVQCEPATPTARQ